MSQSKNPDGKTSTNPLDRTAAVKGYIQVWNETSPEKFQTLLTEVWTPASTYEDPLTPELLGYEGLASHIQKFQSLKPGGRFELNSPVDEYHRLGRFNWILNLPDGTVSYGVDFVEFDENNRLSRVVGFPGHLSRQQK